MPPFLNLPDEAAYRAHYETTYVRSRITTHHGIPVYFQKDKFDHAFYEATNRDGVKNQFSMPRAQRMNWIVATLNAPAADWYQGWITPRKQYDPSRSVAVAYGDFVVVLRFSAKQNGDLKANFVTCYDADNSIGKIRQSPAWTLQDCQNALGV
ncbi:hypothetical protein GCM10011360_38700 [Primorskyibacter flagellatus]|uniref:Uncharacterized protein n=1 Tax=Primorskyibacter flagellatus TaxID=1387277 RepID=A0A917AEY7_9RHOB|nr:hypothetical protein [Primorskyibacter flagellatus]GGE47774.1 hypothetical protein GCM10011360_38700 [Primorskyibacter flagellatus]